MRTIGLVACLVVAITACHGSSDSPRSQPAPIGSGAPTASTDKVYDLPGEANGLWWDAPTATLYLTDSTHGQIVRWTDHDGFATVATLPPLAKPQLGALVRLRDGSFVTTSFGFGSDGAVFHTTASGDTTSVPNLDPARRRIGVTQAPDGKLYDAFFLVSGHEHPSKVAGGVARLDLDKGETDVLTTGLGKAVGVVASSTTLYVSDQEHGAIIALPFDALDKPTTLASGLASADLLTLLPTGDLVTGGKGGAIVRIDAKGAVTTIEGSLDEVRGTAYDADGKRLFVVEHNKATHPRLRIVALSR